ncbi:hypothetical protein KCV01_g14355, partial [Aureobasidium melanogenum]
MIRLDDLQVFVQTVDSGSFSAAARLLDCTPAMASSAVMRLEKELGTRLFVRSTRSMRLSDDGERYLPHARAMLGALADGGRTLAEARGEIAGPLRLSVPSDLGRSVLLGWLDEFQQAHPGITLQLHVSDRAADLLRHPIDAAVRYGLQRDSRLVAQPLAPLNRRVACASPDYLARHPRPTHPDDLRQHNCLCFVWGDLVLDRWAFDLPKGHVTVKVKGNRISDDGDVVRRWAVAGNGIAFKSALDIAADLAAGRLVDLFPGQGELAPVNLTTEMRRFISLISLLAFVVLAIASISASRVASAAGVVAGGMASITRHFPAKVGGYDNMTFEITIAKEPGFNGRTYWAHQFGFAPPADGGYIGLQIRNANDKVVNFSIWNATGWRDSSGSQCARFGHEGEGIQCWRSYAWREGVTYLLRVERVGAADWRASIVDTSTNATTPIATITQPENFVSGITSLSEWVENFAQGNDAHPSCLAVPPAVAVYGIPTAQNGTVKPTSTAPRTVS